MREQTVLEMENLNSCLEKFLDIDIFNYIEVHSAFATIVIEKRPNHCDRGRYIVKVFSNYVEFNVDSSDMFPRYYFIFDNLISEISEWTIKRRSLIFRVD